jgi:hypothetical protein
LVGGLDKAISIAKEMAKEPKAEVVIFPPKLNFFKQLQRIMDGKMTK